MSHRNIPIRSQVVIRTGLGLWRWWCLPPISPPITPSCLIFSPLFLWKFRGVCRVPGNNIRWGRDDPRSVQCFPLWRSENRRPYPRGAEGLPKGDLLLLCPLNGVKVLVFAFICSFRSHLKADVGGQHNARTDVHSLSPLIRRCTNNIIYMKHASFTRRFWPWSGLPLKRDASPLARGTHQTRDRWTGRDET